MAGRRAASKSSERTVAVAILAVGTVVSLASLLGGVWVVRAGVVVAVAMALAAFWFAGRELAAERARHATEMKHEVTLRAQQASRFHEESVAMIGRFNARAENLQGVIAKLRALLGAAKSELSSMRGNAVWLRAEVAERQARIEQLEARIAELEAEEITNIQRLPRNAVRPSIDDIWGEEEHPTMVDLAKLNLDELPDLRMHA
jgi:polyhydroxyalkanoate synthesis regulator phasin